MEEGGGGLRGKQIIRQLEIVCRMLDGRSRRLGDFEDIRLESGVSMKTLRRDLKALENVRRLCMVVTVYEGVESWRMDGKLSQTMPPETTPMVCNKCLKRKTLREFHKQKNAPTGYRTICAKCENAAKVIWRKKNREQINKYRKRYHAKNKAKINSRRREQRAEVGRV